MHSITLRYKHRIPHCYSLIRRLYHYITSLIQNLKLSRLYINLSLLSFDIHLTDILYLLIYSKFS